jgi:predicted RNase H-like nuclease (RuvC/YqgF family)
VLNSREFGIRNKRKRNLLVNHFEHVIQGAIVYLERTGGISSEDAEEAHPKSTRPHMVEQHFDETAPAVLYTNTLPDIV